MIAKIKRGSSDEKQTALQKPLDSEHKFIAHVRQIGDKSWQVHLLDDHLKSVAVLAQRFAQPFGTGDWAYLVTDQVIIWR